MTILDDILAKKRARIEARRGTVPLEVVRERAEVAAPPRDFAAALVGPRIRLIAEIKRASPSKGSLNLDLDPRAQTRLYSEHGAAAISVLCEEDFFQGSLADLRGVRDELTALDSSAPVLCKDFLYDEYQVYEARAAGADTVLLIMTMLAEPVARELMELARSLGMEPLVEVHDEADVAQALTIDARVIGINNRDLRTFVTDLAVTERLGPLVRAGGPGIGSNGPGSRTILVSESGIARAEHVARVAAAGVNAVLVGESIVISADPAGTLKDLTTVPAQIAGAAHERS